MFCQQLHCWQAAVQLRSIPVGLPRYLEIKKRTTFHPLFTTHQYLLLSQLIFQNHRHCNTYEAYHQSTKESIPPNGIGYDQA